MDESDIAIANYSGVGGSTILFSGQYPRFHKSDFKSKSEDNAGVDWPIQYSEIKEFYELNESMVGVAGLRGNKFYPDVKPNMKPVLLKPMGLRFAMGLTG